MNDKTKTKTNLFEPTHKHFASGRLYRLLGYGHREGDMTRVAIYVGEAGDLWDRDQDEFDDPARFEPLPARPPQEHGWVIEDGASNPSRPLYFTGLDGLARYRWSYDHAQAVRFARQQDAEKMTGDGNKHRVAAHIWG